MRHYLMILLVLRERCVMSRRQKEEQRRRTSLIREVNVPDIIHNIMFKSDSGIQQELVTERTDDDSILSSSRSSS